MRRLVLLLTAATAALATANAQEAAKLRGQVLLREDDGSERPPSSGTMELWVDRYGWRKLDLTLENGRFEADIPVSFSWINAGRLVLEGREAWSSFGLGNSLPSDPLRIVAQFVRPSTLRVQEFGSRRDLDELEFLVADSRDWIPHPGFRGRRVASPFPVPLWHPEQNDDETPSERGRQGKRTWLVRAPGMAWSPITIDPSEGGERTHVLYREVVLKVRLQDGRVPADAIVKLRRNEPDRYEPQRLTIAGAGQQIELDGLPAGTYSVVVELLDLTSQTIPKARTGRFLALETVDLTPGVSREVLLSLRDRSEPLDISGEVCAANKHLRGTVKLSTGWDVSRLSMEFHRREPSMHKYVSCAKVKGFQVDSKDPHLLHWDAGHVEAGSWVAVSGPTSWCSSFEIGNGALEPIAFELPPLAEVTLRIVDARNGSEVEPCTVAWHSAFPPPWSSVPGTTVDRDVETKIWKFRAPVGEIVLKPDTYRVYAPKFERVTIRPGVNDITLDL